MGREIGIFRIPKPAEKIIKGTDAGSIAEFKTAEDCIKIGRASCRERV